MPYYIKRKKDGEEESPKPRKPLRRTPLKRVSDKKRKEMEEGKAKPVTSVKKASKPRTKKKSTLIRELDRVFSLYIRKRDCKEFGGRYGRCISCGQIKPFADLDAGHYYSRTKMSVRYSEANVSAECKFCNRFSADHLIGYREHLIRKIGQQRFDLLTYEAQQVKKYDEWELEQMIKYYKVKTDELDAPESSLLSGNRLRLSGR